MDRVSKPAMEPRNERRAMIALLAVFVLLVQALVPAIASASPRPGGEQVICTDHGLQIISLDGTAPAKGPVRPCEHCVCPPLAMQPPAMTAHAVAVSYAREAAPQPTSSDLPPPARAPPRPPGQGPPTSNA